MNKADLPFFCCLGCRSDLQLEGFDQSKGKVIEGVLFCPSCKIFYPISEGIPFLLDSGYYEYFDIQGFLAKWSSRFDFGNYRLLNRKSVPEKLKQLNFYNTDCESYDDLVSYSNFWKASDWNILCEWFKKMPVDGTVLDLGCGTGRCTIPLAREGRHVVATDISIGMLKKALKKSREAGVSSITYFMADAEDLPLKDNLFSAVISFGMLHHVNDPSITIKGIGKVLKTGGIFYALENNASPIRFIFDLLMKIRKLWNEEAGSHPLFNIKEVRGFIKSNGMEPVMRTSTFLPPHLFNLLNYGTAKKVLFTTDRFFGHIPLVSNFGGQLVIRATKNGVER